MFTNASAHSGYQVGNTFFHWSRLTSVYECIGSFRISGEKYFLSLIQVFISGQSSPLSCKSCSKLPSIASWPLIASPCLSKYFKEDSCFSSISLCNFWSAIACLLRSAATLSCCIYEFYLQSRLFVWTRLCMLSKLFMGFFPVIITSVYECIVTLLGQTQQAIHATVSAAGTESFGSCGIQW